MMLSQLEGYGFLKILAWCSKDVYSYDELIGPRRRSTESRNERMLLFCVLFVDSLRYLPKGLQKQARRYIHTVGG